MKCPSCKHEIKSASETQCNHCEQVFPTAELVELENLRYLWNWLKKQPNQAYPKQWDMEIGNQYWALQKKLNPPAAPASAPPAAATALPAPMAATEAQPAPVSIAAPVTSLPTVTTQVEQKKIEIRQVETVKPAQPVQAAPVSSSEKETAQTKTVAPPPGKDWQASLLEFAFSGALLRTLLYLGAFMIVISALVLVVLFWNYFSAPIQVGVIFSVPTFFYGLGWLTHTRMKLPQAGIVLTGIGALLFGVDFGAIYQLLAMPINPNMWWLLSSIICLTLYTLTTWRTQHPFFEGISLLAAQSSLLAGARLIGADFSWTIAVIALFTPILAYLKESSKAARLLFWVETPLALVTLWFLTPAAALVGHLAAALSFGWVYKRSQSIAAFYMALGAVSAVLFFNARTFDINYFSPSLVVTFNIFMALSHYVFSNQPKERLALYVFNGGLGLALLLIRLAQINELAWILACTAASLSAIIWGLMLDKKVLTLLGSFAFFFAFYGLLNQFEIKSQHQPFILALLCGAGYIQAGYWLTKSRPGHAKILDGVGLTMSVVIAFITLEYLGFGAKKDIITHITLPTIIATYIFCAWRFQSWVFSIAVALLFPISTWSWLAYFKTDANANTLIQTILTYLYLLTELGIGFLPKPFSQKSFQLPWKIGMFIMSAITMIYALFAPIMPVTLLAQSACVVLFILCTILYSNRWYLLVASALLPVPYTLAWNKYGQISGVEQYAYTTLLLASFLLIGGFILDLINKQKPTYGIGAYLVGYTLAVASILPSLGDQPTRIIVIGIGLLLSVLSTVIAHLGLHRTLQEIASKLLVKDSPHVQEAGVVFLYAFGLGTPLWLTDLLNYGKTAYGVSLFSLTALALTFFITGMFAKKIHTAYSWPFDISAHITAFFSVLALVFSQNQISLWNISAWGLASTFYFATTWRFNHAFWLYPSLFATTWMANNLMTFLEIPQPYTVLRWVPLLTFYILISRFAFTKKDWQLPFYIFGYGLSLWMLAEAWFDPTMRFWVLLLDTLLYTASIFLFKQARWSYATLASGHMTLLAYLAINPSDSPLRYLAVPFMFLVWTETLIGLVVAWRTTASDSHDQNQPAFLNILAKLASSDSPLLTHLFSPSMSQPFFVFAALDIFIWETIALTGLDTGLIVSIGFGLLLTTLAVIWLDSLLVYGSVPFLILGMGYGLYQQGIEVSTILIFFSAVGVILKWVSLLLQRISQWPARVQSLITAYGISGHVLSGLTLVPAMGMIFSQTEKAAYLFSLFGLLQLTTGLTSRNRLGSYLGSGMLLFAWCLLLTTRQVYNPQAYAIPTGLYLLVISFFERRYNQMDYARFIEGFGLAILLFTSFVQSLQGGIGFIYFLLLIVEGLLAVTWGLYRHFRLPFLTGIGASVLNIVAQVFILVSVYEINRWFIVFGVGFSLIILAILVERRHEQLFSGAMQWRERLESWQ